MPKYKQDEAHEKTDKIIQEMEKQIAKEYRNAADEITKKINKLAEAFDKKNEEMRQKMIDGEITQKQYSDWRVKNIATSDRWLAMRDTLAEEIAKANDIAKSTINGHMEDVYALNRNYAVYQVEKDAMIDTSFTLYNRRSTEALFKNDKSLLPAPKPGTKAWKAAHDKDLRWNQQKINSSMIQGLLQGDSIPNIAKRLIDVVGMNRAAAVRNARTMTTSIENKGRDDAYEDLREKGVELDTIWVSTLDDRTRHSHRLLYGEVRNEETGKFSNGLRYPGDPLGDPEEVYNCRCSEMSSVKGFPIELPRWSPKMGDMTFEEWLGVKEDGLSVSQEDIHVVVNGKDISSTWTRRSDQFDFAIEDVINAQGFDGVPIVASQDEFDEYVSKANGGKGFIAQRTYSAESKEVLDAYKDQLYNGKWYVDCSVGGSQFGQGMYCVSNAEGTSITDGMDKEMENYIKINKGRGNPISVIETFTVTEEVKIIDYNDLVDEFRMWRSSSETRSRFDYSELQNMDVGTYAAMKGYDIIHGGISPYTGASYDVILNRTKVIFLGENL